MRIDTIKDITAIPDYVYSEWQRRTKLLIAEAVTCKCGYKPTHTNFFSIVEDHWVCSLHCSNCKIASPKSDSVEETVARWNLMQALNG